MLLGWTSLLLATDGGHSDIVESLIDNRANVNAVKNDSINSIYIAAKNGRIEIVEHLINAKADTSIAYNNAHDTYSSAIINMVWAIYIR